MSKKYNLASTERLPPKRVDEVIAEAETKLRLHSPQNFGHGETGQVQKILGDYRKLKDDATQSFVGRIRFLKFGTDFKGFYARERALIGQLFGAIHGIPELANYGEVPTPPSPPIKKSLIQDLNEKVRAAFKSRR